MVENRGNTAGGGSHDVSRPLPRADDSTLRRTHEQRPKPTGLDWSRLVPTCKGCGERDGKVNSESGLCPRCTSGQVRPGDPVETPAAAPLEQPVPVAVVDTDDSPDLDDADDVASPAPLPGAGSHRGR